jgi:hypothetical protein
MLMIDKEYLNNLWKRFHPSFHDEDLLRVVIFKINKHGIIIDLDKIVGLLDEVDKKMERPSLDFGELKEARYKIIAIKQILGVKE